MQALLPFDMTRYLGSDEVVAEYLSQVLTLRTWTRAQKKPAASGLGE